MELSHRVLPPRLGQLVLVALFTFFLFRYFGRKRAQPSSKKLKLPPSPPSLPLIGNLLKLGSQPHRSLQALSQKYGPVMLLNLGSVPAIIISSADAAKDVMKTQDLIFASRPASSIADRLFYDSHDVAFAPYGEYWRQVRRITLLHLLSVKRVQSFKSVREEEVALMVDKIRALSPAGMVDLSKMLITLTNDILCRVVLGRRYSEEEGAGSRFRELFLEFVCLLGSFPVRDFIPWLRWVDSFTGLDARMRKNSIELDGFLNKILEDYKSARPQSCDDPEGRRDFLTALLSHETVDDANGGFSLATDNIKALVLDMLAAGTHTTFTVMEWTMAELIRHPEEMKRVQEEVRRVARLGGGIIREEDLDQLKYMKAAIKESMRLHSPVPLLVPRESMENSQVLGHDIPRGMMIIINAWAIGRDARSWDRPEEFMPCRFVDSSIDFNGLDFELIPFGAGRRGCPGIAFAISTIELALANILHHFNWAVPDGKEEEVMDMSETYGIAVHKKSGLTVLVKANL